MLAVARGAPSKRKADQTARISKEGPMPYWIIINGTSWIKGMPPRSQKVGPFATAEEAKCAEPDHVPWDTDSYCYHVQVGFEPDAGFDEGERSGQRDKKTG